jgi:hypothetical protein
MRTTKLKDIPIMGYYYEEFSHTPGKLFKFQYKGLTNDGFPMLVLKKESWNAHFIGSKEMLNKSYIT